MSEAAGSSPPSTAVPEQERPHKEHIRHEAVTMALYVAICLLAALAALKGTVLEHGVVFELVWGTTVGLALAHMFAFLLAGRLIEGRRITAATRATILAQLVGAAAVALLVTIAIVLVPTSDELDAARVDLAVIIGITGYVVSRNVARTRLRAVLFAIIVTAVGLAVAAIKYWVGH